MVGLGVNVSQMVFVTVGEGVVVRLGVGLTGTEVGSTAIVALAQPASQKKGRIDRTLRMILRLVEIRTIDSPSIRSISIISSVDSCIIRGCLKKQSLNLFRQYYVLADFSQSTLLG